MVWKAPARVKCMKCTKTVYAMEEVRIENGVYHKNCFRCSHCNRVVSNTTYSQFDGVIYCKPHFMELFKRRGKYNDLSSGASASTNIQRQHQQQHHQEDRHEEQKLDDSHYHHDQQEQQRQQQQQQQHQRLDASRWNFFQDAKSEEQQPELRRALSKRKPRDIFQVLKMRNASKVRDYIQEHGVQILFENIGPDGSTPVEFAFKSNNVDCGRVMLELIRAEVLTQQQ